MDIFGDQQKQPFEGPAPLRSSFLVVAVVFNHTLPKNKPLRPTQGKPKNLAYGDGRGNGDAQAVRDHEEGTRELCPA